MKIHEAARQAVTTGATDFRALLQRELLRRCADNPQYSLRAFALALGTDHASLSQLLRGRRTLTARTIRRLGPRLGLPADAVEQHVARARRTPPVTARAPTRRLKRDVADALTSWHHFALLELLRLDDFRPDVRWIARVLGIDTDDVARALSCLCRLGLLRMEGARWVDASGDAAATEDDFARLAAERLSARLRREQLAARARAPDAVFEDVALTLAVHRERLPELSALLDELRHRLADLCAGDGEAHEVYRLELALHPLTDPVRRVARAAGEPRLPRSTR